MTVSALALAKGTSRLPMVATVASITREGREL